MFKILSKKTQNILFFQCFSQKCNVNVRLNISQYSIFYIQKIIEIIENQIKMNYHYIIFMTRGKHKQGESNENMSKGLQDKCQDES